MSREHILQLNIRPTLDGVHYLGEQLFEMHLPPLEPDRDLEVQILELRAQNARLSMQLVHARSRSRWRRLLGLL